MKINNSATAFERIPLSSSAKGLQWGLLGVAGFSLTVPLTRLTAQHDQTSSLFVGAGRAVLASALALIALLLSQQSWPQPKQWLRLAVAGSGIVVGFPLLTSYALRVAPASHGAVVIALLPATTALVTVIRTKQRLRKTFWIWCGIGAACAVGFAAVRGGRFDAPQSSDLLLFLAVLAAAVGYTEGGLLAGELGAWQPVCWALMITAPLTVPLTIFALCHNGLPSFGSTGWVAFTYLGLISMFLAFFAWYRGLATGPMVTVGQVQLVQPVLSIIWAATLLGEHLDWTTVLGGSCVIVATVATVRTKLNGQAPREGAQNAAPDGVSKYRHSRSRMGKLSPTWPARPAAGLDPAIAAHSHAASATPQCCEKAEPLNVPASHPHYVAGYPASCQ